MPQKRVTSHKLNRKPQILEAAQKLFRKEGLGGVTTRAIADEVGCSEAAIYVHFGNRFELLMAVFDQALPEMLEPLKALEKAVGEKTPESNLIAALRGLRKFHDDVVPMLGSLFADSDLLTRFRKSLAERAKGPQGGIDRLARYIREEQAHGRIHISVDAEAAAAALMSASLFQAFTRALFGAPAPGASMQRIVRSALRCIDE